nr:Uncharacterised protein [Klebsiella pneumoniae]
MRSRKRTCIRTYSVWCTVISVLMGNDDEGTPLTTILTTHSPHIASVTPVRSIVLLRYDSEDEKTIAVSTANAPFSRRDEDDLQRYIDVTRGEIFFHVV